MAGAEAVISDALAEWQAFSQGPMLQGLSSARQLRFASEVDEHEPYKSSYASADVLKGLHAQAHALLQGLTGMQHEAHVCRCLAQISLERGLALLDTDLLAEGERELTQALGFDWPNDDAESLVLQQAARNALGALWRERGDCDAACEHLARAEQLHAAYCNLLSASSGGDVQHQTHLQRGEQQACAEPQLKAGAEPVGAPSEPSLRERADAQYTTTLFYLSQVHLHRGDKHQSAMYCAATLGRQLKAGARHVGCVAAEPQACSMRRSWSREHGSGNKESSGQQRWQPEAAPRCLTIMRASPLPPMPCHMPFPALPPPTPPRYHTPACTGSFDPDDWVQNCLHLSGYFLSIHAYALSEYCLLAADAVASGSTTTGTVDGGSGAAVTPAPAPSQAAAAEADMAHGGAAAREASGGPGSEGALQALPAQQQQEQERRVHHQVRGIGHFWRQVGSLTLAKVDTMCMCSDDNTKASTFVLQPICPEHRRPDTL